MESLFLIVIVISVLLFIIFYFATKIAIKNSGIIIQMHDIMESLSDDVKTCLMCNKKFIKKDRKLCPFCKNQF